MKTKLCKICNENKPIEEFTDKSNKNGCKSCLTQKRKEYYTKNKEKISSKYKEYYKKNKDVIIDKGIKYYNDNKELRIIQKKEYYKKNKKRIIKRENEYAKARKKVDVEYKIKCNLRTRINKTVRNITKIKSKRTLELLGCSMDHFKIHLESQFTKQMNWNNYGIYGWHIDHIKPCSSFDLTDPKQQEECFHYTNMQPLWCIDNIKIA